MPRMVLVDEVDDQGMVNDDFEEWLDSCMGMPNPETRRDFCDCGTDVNWVEEVVATRYDPKGFATIMATCLACHADMSFGQIEERRFL